MFFNKSQIQFVMMNRIIATAIILIISLSMAMAQTEVAIGDEIASFKANDHAGKVWELDKHLKKSEYLVIYFYPAAMTGGCTKQACAFRDNKSNLDSLNVTVIGVSGDKPEGLEAFRKMHQLNFTMLSDYSGDIATIFGVPTSKGGTIDREVDGKKMILERGVTARRWTFVLDTKGKVVFKNSDVDVNTESKALLSWLKSNK